MNENNGKLLFAALAGAAVGFALGMLLAPEKGSDLRKNILGSLDDVGNRVGKAVSQGREKLMDLAGLASEEADEFATTAGGMGTSGSAGNTGTGNRGKGGMNPSRQGA
jgi:gas vesicle protein